ncbi:MAG: hypothetical protein Q8L48_39715 [Archangium sp.]|nr:hypothetical protein [Archangium sp.]
MTQTDWQASSVQLAGLSKQAKAHGLLDAALAKCSQATREAFENPYGARWHPGAQLTEFGEALLTLTDPVTLENINYEMTKASFGSILRPVVQVALALTGRSPGTLFARVPTSLPQALKHVTCAWEPEGKSAGALRFTYPTAVSPYSGVAWRGVVRFLSELAGQPARVTEAIIEGNTLRLSVAW